MVAWAVMNHLRALLRKQCSLKNRVKLCTSHEETLYKHKASVKSFAVSVGNRQWQHPAKLFAAGAEDDMHNGNGRG